MSGAAVSGGDVPVRELVGRINKKSYISRITRNLTVVEHGDPDGTPVLFMERCEHVKAIIKCWHDISSTLTPPRQFNHLLESENNGVPCRYSNTRSSRLGPIQCSAAPSESSSVSTSAPLLCAHFAYAPAVVSGNANLISEAFCAFPKRYLTVAMCAARRHERPLFSRKDPTAIAKAAILCVR